MSERTGSEQSPGGHQAGFFGARLGTGQLGRSVQAAGRRIPLRTVEIGVHLGSGEHEQQILGRAQGHGHGAQVGRADADAPGHGQVERFPHQHGRADHLGRSHGEGVPHVDRHTAAHRGHVAHSHRRQPVPEGQRAVQRFPSQGEGAEHVHGQLAQRVPQDRCHFRHVRQCLQALGIHRPAPQSRTGGGDPVLRHGLQRRWHIHRTTRHARDVERVEQPGGLDQPLAGERHEGVGLRVVH